MPDLPKNPPRYSLRDVMAALGKGFPREALAISRRPDFAPILADLRPIHKRTSVEVCRECGSVHVEHDICVDANTGELRGDGSSTETYCRRCHTHNRYAEWIAAPADRILAEVRANARALRASAETAEATT